MTPIVDSSEVKKIRCRLLEWYYQYRRNLPWRGESSPYRIWVSEVMLQQTQVTTVIPYYHRFLAKFADVWALAAAPLEEVLKVWEGLGYYARARNLHKAAIEIVKKYDGQLPQTYAELRRLPGFGDYTAGAVAAIAFGEAVPAIDGNAKRLLARLFAIKGDIQRGKAAQQLKQTAVTLVDPNHPGDWTQAMMELGATVCLPLSPRCSSCPIHDLCAAHLQGIEQELPIKSAKKDLPHYDVTAAVIRQGGKVLIAQRPLDGMLGGLWEFPGGKQKDGETLAECLRREIQEELGLEIEVGQPLVSIKHGYTHFKITLHAFYCRLLAGQPQALEVADWRWVALDEMDAFPFARSDLKIIAALKKQKTPARD
ncbi:MAG: A/G-specific adenine glycosylase [Anaerolineae bacterium]|nr:A/G-specific adenine glycosylase [Anaerolineae bacterium]